jgi:galactokinase
LAIQKSNDPICTAIANDRSETFTYKLSQLEAVANGGWQNYMMGVVDEIQKKGKQIQPFDVVFGGDIPPGAGLSSSAALENALVFVLNELFKLGLSKMEMILISQAAENNFAGVQSGIMDQYTSMFGQKDAALFLDCNNLQSEVVPIKNDEYQLILLNTNVTHILADTAYNERRGVCSMVAKHLGVSSLRELDLKTLLESRNQFTEEDFQKALFVFEENKRVVEAVTAIKKNELQKFGELLFRSHSGLQTQYKVSCPELDFLVDLAKESEDVLGARMMGGGFGGCTLNLIHKNKVGSFIEMAIKKYSAHFNKSLSAYPVTPGDGTRLIA